MAGFGGWWGGVRTVFGGWGLDGMVDESEGWRGWGAWAGGVRVDEFAWNAAGAPDGGRSRVRARRGGGRERSAARREKRRGSGERDGWFDRLTMNGDRIVKNADRVSLSEGGRRGGRKGRGERGEELEKRGARRGRKSGKQRAGRIGARRAEGIWSVGCKAYPASVHYLGTNGNHGVVGGDEMPGTAGRERRVPGTRLDRGRGVAWPRMASTASGWL